MVVSHASTSLVCCAVMFRSELRELRQNWAAARLQSAIRAKMIHTTRCTSETKKGAFHCVCSSKNNSTGGADVRQKAQATFWLLTRVRMIAFRRLHRKNLVERLFFEENMVMGTIRLVNQIMVFALLVMALNGSSDQETKRGIYQDLDAIFDFQGLQELGSRDEFRDTMLHVARNSKVQGIHEASLGNYRCLFRRASMHRLECTTESLLTAQLLCSNSSRCQARFSTHRAAEHFRWN